MDALRPYDVTKMVVGAVRVVIGDADGTSAVPVPTALQDIQDLISTAGAYPLADDYRDIGAATDGSEYTHGRESTGMEIQQETGSIFEEITQVSRGFNLSMAELDTDNVQFIEAAAAIETIAAAAGAGGPQKSVGLGSYTDLPAYRMALIGVRKLSAGEVVEPAPSSRSRGRLVAVVLNRVTLSADENTVAFGKGTLANVSLGVTAFPEPGESGDDAYGRWLFEDAATILAGP